MSNPNDLVVMPERRRAEDREELAARTKAWEEFQGHPGPLFEVFQRALDVYRSELATNALRRMGAGRW